MLRIIFLAVALIVGASRVADAEGEEMAQNLAKVDFPGWEVFSAVEGDLDGDTFKDLVAIMQKPAENGDQAKDVKLIIYFSDWQHRHFRQLVSDNAICYGCGGVKAVWDQPFGELSIDKGLLKITYEGGSREVFTTTAKWRFDKASKKFLLIGETENTVDTAREEPDDTLDINFLNLKMIHTIGKKSRTCAVPQKYRAIDLATFNYEDGNEDMLEKLSASCKP